MASEKSIDDLAGEVRYCAQSIEMQAQEVTKAEQALQHAKIALARCRDSHEAAVRALAQANTGKPSR